MDSVRGFRCKRCRHAQTRHSVQDHIWRCADGQPSPGFTHYSEERGRVATSFNRREAAALHMITATLLRGGDVTELVRSQAFGTIATKARRLHERAKASDVPPKSD